MVRIICIFATILFFASQHNQKKMQFGKDFYPTPKEVFNEMWNALGGSLAFGEKFILDPSAGSGNLLTFINEKIGSYYKRPKALHGIEIDGDLRNVLNGKGLTVVHDDFLTFQTYYNYDVIIMNPPFSDGAKHLLKAWEIAGNTKIACLLNAETIDNPYTVDRELLAKIIADNNGTVKHLGNCFATADRKTNVDIVLVVLEKKKEAAWKFEGAKFEGQQYEMPKDFSENLPAVTDYLKAKEYEFKAAATAAIEVKEALSKFKHYAKGFAYMGQDVEKLLNDGTTNELIDYLNRSAWDDLLKQADFRSRMTERVRREFDEKFTMQSKVAFTKPNMLELMEALFQNQGAILDQCVLDAFDYLTNYYEENRSHVEGWKTNDRWMVNRKVVIPWIMEACWSDGLQVRYEAANKLYDLDKAMCHLCGKNPERILTMTKAINVAGNKNKLAEYLGGLKGKDGEPDKENRINPNYEKRTCESEFFKIKFFKKRTIHLEFKDEWLYQKFNQVAVGGKGWLMGTDGQSFQRQRKKAA